MARKTAQSRRKQGESRHRYPSIEFKAASWVLERWSKKCDQRGQSKRKVELSAKLEQVREAIVPSQPEAGYRKQEKIPDVLVADEHGVVSHAVTELTDVLAGSDSERHRSRVLSARCVYDFDEPHVKLVRPLLIDRSSESVDRIISFLAKPLPALRKTSNLLAAELFALSPRHVEAVVAAQTKERHRRVEAAVTDQKKGSSAKSVEAF